MIKEYLHQVVNDFVKSYYLQPLSKSTWYETTTDYRFVAGRQVPYEVVTNTLRPEVVRLFEQLCVHYIPEYYAPDQIRLEAIQWALNGITVVVKSDYLVDTYLYTVTCS